MAPFHLETRPIPCAIGYHASKCGKIISHHRLEPFALKTARHPCGYRKVVLKVENGYKNFLVHRLVMLAWVGPCPKGAVTNHKNGDKTDNRLENLEYCSQSYNMAHSFAMGLSPKPPTHCGERAPKAKLTEPQVIELRELAANGATIKELASAFGVTPSTASKIVLRHTWKHLPNT